ncbi:MAG: AarF/ABC1/UbiB kinase family protein [bacterium]|nr:AarF/ABC1/UbiB kinase family protein [bacterium]
MLDKKLIPTPLIRPDERPPIIIDRAIVAKHHRVIYFALRFSRFLRQMLWLKLTRRLDAPTIGVLLRTLFQEMGVLWIKVGQLLSLRVDLLSHDICGELSKLQDQAHGFSPVIARRILEEDLGAPAEHFFDRFSDTPFAAASISQVHKAYLKREKIWVAIKIRKPDAQKIFAQDMAIIRWLMTMLARLSIKPYMRWDDMRWEVEHILVEELDYHYEATNMRRMKKTMRRHKIYVPKVFQRYSTKRVLVMEFVQGALMTDYLNIAHRDPKRLHAWLNQNHINAEKLGRRLYVSNLRQIYEDNLFHGDLHPGNIVLLRDSRFAFIDFGSIGSSDPDFIEKHLLYLEAMTSGQFAKVFDLYMLFPDNIPAIPSGDLKEEFIRLFQAWHDRGQNKELPYDERAANSMTNQLIELLGRYQITMPWYFLRFMRAFSTLDAALRDLIPQEDIGSLTVSYLKQRERRTLRNTLRQQQRSSSVRSLTAAIIETPITLHETMIFRGDIVRRMAQVFEGISTKVTQGIHSMLMMLTICLRVLGLGLALAYVEQQHGLWLMPFVHHIFDALLRWMPHLDVQVWFIVGIALFYLDRRLVNIRRRVRTSKP